MTKATFWDWWSPSTLTLVLVFLAKVKKQIKTVSVDIWYSFMPFSFTSWPQGLIKIAIKIWPKWFELFLCPKHAKKSGYESTWSLNKAVLKPIFLGSEVVSLKIPTLCRTFIFLGVTGKEKNLQGTVASGNEQRRVLPRSCRARTILAWSNQR